MPEIFSLWSKVSVEDKSAMSRLRAIEQQADRTARALKNLERTTKIGRITGGSGGLSVLPGGGGGSVRRTRGAIQLPADMEMDRAMADIARFRSQRTLGNRVVASQLEQSRRAQAAILKRQNTDEIRRLSGLTPRRPSNAMSGLGAAGSGVGAGGSALMSLGHPAAVAAGLGLAAGGAAITGFKTAIDKTIEADRANRLLSASATEAGKSYSFLAKKNQDFAKTMGLSNVAAAATTAKITQLATFSGDASEKNIDKLMRSFADLAAARGIGSDELETLVGTILSGQDEGLNRLGIADPSKVYEAFAKKKGVSAESLTQTQKVQALTEAVTEKAGIFAGAAEDRMNSLEGQVLRTTAAWENFTTALSQAVTSSREAQGVLALLGGAVEVLTNSSPRNALQEKVRAGTVTADDIKAASKSGMVSGGEPVIGGMISLLGWATGNEGMQKFGDILGNSEEMDARSLAQTASQVASQQALQAKQEEAARQQQRELAKKSLKEAEEKLARDQRSALERGQSLATLEREGNFAVSSARIGARPDLNKQQELRSLRDMSALREADLRAQMDERKRNTQALLNIPGMKMEDRIALEQQTSEELKKLDTELTVHRINSQKEIMLAERAAAEERKKMAQEFRSVQAAAQDAQTGGNAATLAADAATNIQNAFDQFKDFDIRMARAAMEAQRIAEAMRLGAAAFESGMSAINFRNQAVREGLRNPDDLSGRSRRRQAFENALDIVNRGQGFRQDAALADRLFSNPFADTENFAAIEQLYDFTATSSRFSDIARQIGDMGMGGAAIMAQAQLAALPDVGTLAALAQKGGRVGGMARNALGTVGDLNRTLAANQENELKKELARNQAIEKTVLPAAQAQMDFINQEMQAGRITDKAGLDAFLSITDELGDEITPEMLRLRVEALKERAKIEEDNRRELIEAIKNSKAQITVNAYGGATTDVTPTRPNQSSTPSTR